MSIKKWLLKNTYSLRGRAVAITGSTGGLGRELCKYLASLSADIILLDRNKARSEAHRAELLSNFKGISVECITLDLEDMESVREAVLILKEREVDYLINNAGAYSIPRHKCQTGLDNVFQINFASPYYMTRELLPDIFARGGRVVTVGSIAHNYSKIDENDLDFSTRVRASLVYGNAKRYLMYSAARLSALYWGAVAITHPGITFTNITAHYPKLIFALIKYPMKLIFMRPRKAALSVLKGIFEPTRAEEWIGPRLFNVWGYPVKKAFATADLQEKSVICERAELVYKKLKNKCEKIT